MSEASGGPAAPPKEVQKEVLHNPYGKGFMVRMGLLLGLLLLVGSMFAYERFVMIPNANRAIAEASGLMKEKSGDGHGIPRDKVQEIMGREPAKSENNKAKINMDRKEGEPERDATICLLYTSPSPRDS